MSAPRSAPDERPAVPFARRPRRGIFQHAPGTPWRSREDRVVSGVAGGLAEWSGLPSMLVRVGLTFVLVGTGFGPVIYVVATAVLPVSDRGVDAADRPLVLPPKGRAREQAAVALLVAIGMSILLRAVGIWMGGGLGFPAALAAAGISLAWSRTDRERRELWRARLVRLPGDQ